MSVSIHFLVSESAQPFAAVQTSIQTGCGTAHKGNKTEPQSNTHRPACTEHNMNTPQSLAFALARLSVLARH